MSDHRSKGSHYPRKGAPGIQGDKGQKGLTGDIGIKGQKGDRGEPRTIQGTAGPQGYQGPRGLPGTRGTKGDKGSQGIDGNKGLIGHEGKRGSKGALGPKGSRGRKGPSGDPGILGPLGPVGDSLFSPGIQIILGIARIESGRIIAVSYSLLDLCSIEPQWDRMSVDPDGSRIYLYLKELNRYNNIYDANATMILRGQYLTGDLNFFNYMEFVVPQEDEDGLTKVESFQIWIKVY